MNINLMIKVAETGSKLEKQRLLAACDERDLRILKLVLDPGITFGVTADEDDLASRCGNVELDQKDTDKWWDDVYIFLRMLSVRQSTGGEAMRSISKLAASAPNSFHAAWFARVLNKDLRAGFSQSTLNKVFPGIIEPFAVSLAKVYEPDRHELEGLWLVEPKLDGLRMVIVDGVAYTRNGRVIHTVDHILDQLGRDMLTKFVIDGEVMGSSEFDENSGATRRKSTGTNETLVYNPFDMVPIGEWSSRSTRSTQDRKVLMTEHIRATPNVDPVIWQPLKPNPTGHDIFKMRDVFMNRGFEGIMLKNAAAPYRFKRSDDLLKVKDFVDADGKVVDTIEGKGKHKGKLGALMVEFDGVVTKVGSGFSDEQRERYWLLRKEIVDDIVECKYQNKTPDGKLRFPVFVKFRHDRS